MYIDYMSLTLHYYLSYYKVYDWTVWIDAL